MNEVRELESLSSLSREFGTSDYVKGGGGNTSVKTGDLLWIKPSGTTLAGLTPEAFVAVDRRKLASLYAMEIPPEADRREARVKDLMTAAVCGGSRGRPSVETPLHDILDATYVVHTHPIIVNGLTCARNGRAEAAKLFPEALWVPYTDPGFTLSMAVREQVQAYRNQCGRQPSLILLENHGIFVSGDSPDEVRGHYRRVMDTLRAAYRRAGVDTELAFTGPVPSQEASEDLARLVKALPGLGAGVAVGAPFDVAPEPLTPDHMVYAKAYPLIGSLTVDNVTAFVDRHGYAPRVLITPETVIGSGRTTSAAGLALELAQDGGLVKQLAGAFGGVQYLRDASREFIESWEVESYREQQLAKPE